MATRTTSSTVAKVPFLTARRFGDSPAQSSKRDGTWKDLSFTELGAIAGEIARGLIALGLQHGSRVAVLAESRAEWVQAAAHGIAAAGCPIVPVYASKSAEECDWALRTPAPWLSSARTPSRSPRAPGSGSPCRTWCTSSRPNRGGAP